MASKNKKLIPQHPGKVLAFMLIQIISKQLELSFDDALSFISGKSPVTPELNSKLSKVFNTNDSYWMELQKLYDEAGSHDEEEETILV